MLNENAKKWVAALRSGEYKQTNGALRTNNHFCCLGVACDLAVKAGVIPAGELVEGRNYKYGVILPSRGGLPVEVREWLRISSMLGHYFSVEEDQALARDNDQGKTFLEIADIIESEPVGLFEETK